jgi:ADP-ribose pyrophosphatase YjhB (NUDIX family)
VINGNKILLVRRAPHLLDGGKWGIIGGYVERDETTKEAAAREIFEETGYKVADITLLTIRDNPDRPHEDRQNVVFVHFCNAKNKEGEPDAESTEQRWFSFDALPKEDEFAFDHYKNIQLYLRYKEEKFPLPHLE